MKRPRFLVTDGPNAHIHCCACRKATRMTPAPNGEITRREIAYYKASHVCGPPTEPWDVEPEGEDVVRSPSLGTSPLPEWDGRQSLLRLGQSAGEAER